MARIDSLVRSISARRSWNSKAIGPATTIAAGIYRQNSVGNSIQKLVRLAWASARCRSVVRKLAANSRSALAASAPRRSDDLNAVGELLQGMRERVERRLPIDQVEFVGQHGRRDLEILGHALKRQQDILTGGDAEGQQVHGGRQALFELPGADPADVVHVNTRHRVAQYSEDDPHDEYLRDARFVEQSRRAGNGLPGVYRFETCGGIWGTRIRT